MSKKFKNMREARVSGRVESKGRGGWIALDFDVEQLAAELAVGNKMSAEPSMDELIVKLEKMLGVGDE